MLDERRTTGISYDRVSDALSLRAKGDLGSAGTRDARLLVDAAGKLVGVDFDGATGRIVVMAGPHEAVERVVPARVQVTATGSVVVGDAKRLVRGDEPNPYA